MESVETEAATVELAVEAALRQLGRREDEVEVEVISKGSKGFFGLGSSVAKVRVSLKVGGILPPEALERATEFLVRIIKMMGMDVEVEAKQHGNELYLEVDQGAGGILIGRRGSTLAALSTIMERVVNRGEGVDVKVFVDVAGYLERRRRALVTMAAKVAEEVRTTGRSVELEPMSAFERKVIHTALHHDKTVRTFSRGEGADRAVVVCKPGQEEAPSGPGGHGGRDGERGPRQGGRGDDRGERGGRGGGGGRWGGGDRGGRGGPGGPGGRGGRGGGRGGFQGRPSMDDMPPPLEREGEIGDESAFDGGAVPPLNTGDQPQEGGRGNWRGPRGGRGGRGGGGRFGGSRGGRGGGGRFGGNRGGGGFTPPAGGAGESGPTEG